MSKSLQDLGASTGVDAGTIEKVLGGVLAFIKPRVSAETYATIETKVPEARRVVTDFTQVDPAGEPAAEEGSQGGLLGRITEMAGKAMGGESGGGDLLGSLIKLGVPAASIATILAQLLTYLKAHLPADVMKQIAAALPAVPGVEPAHLLGGPDDDTVDYPETSGEGP